MPALGLWRPRCGSGGSNADQAANSSRIAWQMRLTVERDRAASAPGPKVTSTKILKTHKPGLNVPFMVVCGDGRAGVTIDNLKNLGFVNIRDTSSGFTSFVKDNGLHEFLSSL